MAEPRLSIFTERTVEKTCRTHAPQNIYQTNERKRKITEPTSLEIFMIYRTNEETCRIKSLRLFIERTRKFAEQRASVYVSNGRTKVETCRDNEPRSIKFTKQTTIAAVLLGLLAAFCWNPPSIPARINECAYGVHTSYTPLLACTCVCTKC